MNILCVEHYAGSPAYGMEFRPYHFAREWSKSGHSVRILAASFTHVRARQPDLSAMPRDGRAFAEDIDGITYSWYPTPRYSGNGMGRVRNIWAFCRQIWRDAPRIARDFRPDAVIASSVYPMDIWPARRIARLTRETGKTCRLAFELHDLWPLSPMELHGMSRFHPFILLCAKAERDVYRHADAVVSILPKAQDHVEALGFDLSKLHHVPNGIVEADWRPENRQALTGALKDFLGEQQVAGRTVVGYAGAHGAPNALEYLLNAAKLLENEPLSFVLVGKGMEKDRLMRKARQEHLNNVFFFDPVPKTQIPELLSHFDIAYIGLKKQPLFRFGISPNKLVDYMMAARPVLHSVEAGNDPVAEAACGLTVAPEDPQAIAEGILCLARLPEEERRAMGERGRAHILKHQTYTVLAEKFLNALKG